MEPGKELPHAPKAFELIWSTTVVDIEVEDYYVREESHSIHRQLKGPKSKSKVSSGANSGRMKKEMMGEDIDMSEQPNLSKSKWNPRGKSDQNKDEEEDDVNMADTV
jgi:hypothetical protein